MECVIMTIFQKFSGVLLEVCVTTPFSSGEFYEAERGECGEE